MKKNNGFTLAEVLIPKRMRGIINGVSDSRMSKIKAPFSLNKKSVAFTLAEVLITLAIIGVVAALTISTVVSKYQKQQYYTQFMKSYNTLSNAYDLSKVNNGPVWEWSDLSDQLDLPNSDIMDKYFLPYLKVSKACDSSNISDCYDVDEIEYIDGTKEEVEDFFEMDNAYILSDGSVISIYGHYMKSWKPISNDTGIDFYVDTNGAKGPNILGRDIFFLSITSSANNLDINKIKSDLNSIFGFEEYDPDDEEYNSCEPTAEESEGRGCADRLLKERKMDY